MTRRVWRCLALAALAVVPRAVAAFTLRPGDIVVTDNTGSIIQIDAATGAPSVLVSGWSPNIPTGVAIDSGGNIVVLRVGTAPLGAPADGAIVRITPASGAQTVVSQGGELTRPMGLAIGPDGNLWVADAADSQLIRVNPTSGDQAVVAAGAPLDFPKGLAIAANGDILVASPGNHLVRDGWLVRVTPAGVASVVSSGNRFANPFGVVIGPNGEIYVAEAGFGTDPGVILRIDPSNGAQSVISDGYDFPSATAIDASGDIFFAVYTNIWRLSPATRAASVVGHTLVQSFGMAVVPPGIPPSSNAPTIPHPLPAINLIDICPRGLCRWLPLPSQCLSNPSWCPWRLPRECKKPCAPADCCGVWNMDRFRVGTEGMFAEWIQGSVVRAAEGVRMMPVDGKEFVPLEKGRTLRDGDLLEVVPLGTLEVEGKGAQIKTPKGGMPANTAHPAGTWLILVAGEPPAKHGKQRAR